MKQATFTEVRNHAKQYFDIVESGETVRVLRNGKPIADIVPVMADIPSWKRRKAQPLVLDSVSVSRMILEERAAGFLTGKTGARFFRYLCFRQALYQRVWHRHRAGLVRESHGDHLVGHRASGDFLGFLPTATGGQHHRHAISPIEVIVAG
jgi:antitoxin (DNA-binding transcriptional repressor) of toxin-antitoxin stability system